MHFSGTSTLLLSIASLASAQYGSPVEVSSSSTISSSHSSIQTVIVAQNGLSFSPNVIKADPGSKIEFRFVASTSHSVAQASFNKPCQPLGDNAFFSGALTSASPKNTFTLTVNDTNALWFYCAFPSHCQSGMVGVINPPANGGKTLDQFKAAAANVATTVPPPRAQGGVLGGAGTAPSGSTTGTATTATPKPSSGAMGLVEGGNIGMIFTAAGIAGLAGIFGGFLA